MANTVRPVDDPIVACFSPGDAADQLCGGFQPSASSLVSSLLENDPAAVVALDCAFDVVAANSAARKMLSMADIQLPAPAARFLGSQVLSRIEALFSSPAAVETASFPVEFPNAPDNGPLHARASRLADPAGRTIGVTLVFSGTLWDQFALPQACRPERVEALGLYAAGIVHEFNNLLTVISGRAGLGLMAHGPAAKDRALENVMTAARRAEHITKNLLTYVQHLRPDFLLVDLRRPVQDAISLLEIEFTAGRVEIVRAFDELPAVRCDPVQIAQVCFNLLRNARDAMPEGGAVTVTLRKQGPWAVLAIADNGMGIPPEILPRLFEPFVSHGRSTTLKPSGTGLGLFVSREIVLAHGGEIAVESAVARGSTFTVRLPISSAR